MAKFALFFSYTPDAWNRLLMKPSDRTAAVRQLMSGVGGTLESFYYMLGDRDGFVVVDVPDAGAAAAASITSTSSGLFSHVETRQLISPEDLPAVLEKAASARESYRPPGE